MILLIENSVAGHAELWETKSSFILTLGIWGSQLDSGQFPADTEFALTKKDSA